MTINKHEKPAYNVPGDSEYINTLRLSPLSDIIGPIRIHKNDIIMISTEVLGGGQSL